MSGIKVCWPPVEAQIVKAGQQEGHVPEGRVPRLSLAAEESADLREALAAALAVAGRFELAPGAADDAEMRLVAPSELAASGAGLLRRHRLRHPDVPVVVIASDGAPASLIRDCFRQGAEDVLCADEIDDTLGHTLARAAQRHRKRQSDEDHAASMAAQLGKRARELEEALARLDEAYDSTLAALVSALDMREAETACHSQRVALYALLLGLRAEFDEAAARNLYRGSLLHDIGKIGIPDSVLLKPGSFDECERAVMQRHTVLGDAMLREIGFLTGAREVPAAHHEAWDGSGYPAGLAGDEIPIGARIFAVVDSYDAIRSRRPYKAAQPHAQAARELREAAGARLDPGLVDLFVAEPESSWELLADAARSRDPFPAALTACREIIARGGPGGAPPEPEPEGTTP